MKRKLISLTLAAALVLGLAVPALAAGQTFTDVPSSYWGYADIEAVAEAGLMNGTGGGAFSPEMKVSVAQFLTLLGRLVFPDVKAEGADWFGPYVTAAQEAKLLDGTQVDVNNVEAEISRYDMAVILRAAAKRMGVKETLAKQSEVKDYMDISTRYADSVLAVYGMGLIKGDQAGNFNGSNTMMRAEVATVIMRLARTPEAKAWANLGDIVEPPRTGESVTVKVNGRINAEVIGARVGFYYKDGRLLGETKTNGTTDSEDYTLWSMDVTMDKADYSQAEKLYYAALIGQAQERVSGGMVETPEEYRDLQSFKDITTSGFLVRVKVAESEQPAEPQEMRMEGWMRYGAKGDPEHKGTGVANVPFQLRYTEDNGATYTVIADGVTGVSGWLGDDNVPGHFQLTTSVDRATFTKFWIGEGQLYISAETTVNGQRYVTQDRRTDGKAMVIPIDQEWNFSCVELVPADRGETVEVPIVGIVSAQTYVGPADRSGQIRYYGSGKSTNENVLTNSTVKIYFDPQQEGADPVLIWETTADGGSFNEVMTIDTAYYRATGKHYVIEIEAVLDGQLCTDPHSLDPISLTYLMGGGNGSSLGAFRVILTSDEYWEIGFGGSRPSPKTRGRFFCLDIFLNM